MTKSDEKKHKIKYANYGVGIGIALGAAVGVVTGNVGLWLALGLCIGAGYDATRTKKTNDKEEDNGNSNN